MPRTDLDQGEMETMPSPPEKPAVLLGRLLIRLRSEKRWNQREFAGYMRMPPATISAWETGRSMPEGNSLVRIAKLFDTTVSDLLQRAGIERAPLDARTVERRRPIPLYALANLTLDQHGHPVGARIGEMCRINIDRDPNAYAVQIDSNAFYPRIWRGDRIEVTTDERLAPGFFLLWLPGERAPLVRKVIQREDGTFRAEPVNPADEAFDIEDPSRLAAHKILSIRVAAP